MTITLFFKIHILNPFKQAPSIGMLVDFTGGLKIKNGTVTETHLQVSSLYAK